MKSLPVLIALGLIAATPALAAHEPGGAPHGTRSSSQVAPPGTGQASPGGATVPKEFRDLSQEQSIAEQPVPPDAPRFYRRHPGKPTKLASSGISPEVQFEKDWREADQKAWKARHGK